MEGVVFKKFGLPSFYPPKMTARGKIKHSHATLEPCYALVFALRVSDLSHRVGFHGTLLILSKRGFLNKSIPEASGFSFSLNRRSISGQVGVYPDRAPRGRPTSHDGLGCSLGLRRSSSQRAAAARLCCTATARCQGADSPGSNNPRCICILQGRTGGACGVCRSRS